MESLMAQNHTNLDHVSLEWGIKESFRSYFERLPDHHYGLVEGTRRCSDGQIEFQADLDANIDASTFAFKGTLKLSAHYGALAVTIANPHVTLTSAGAGVLSAEVDEADGKPVRMVIADLTGEHFKTKAQSRLTLQATLAEEGQYLFMGNYFAGDEMDPITIWFSAP